MPPKAKTPLAEELIEALQDSKVAEALARALSPFIQLSIDEALAKRLKGFTKSVKDVKTENSRLSKRVDDLSADNAVLRKELTVNSQRMEDVDAYSRSDNLIIKGLSETSAAERATAGAVLNRDQPNESHLAVEATVISFARDVLKVDISARDISIAHRLKAGPKTPFDPSLSVS